jgi:hypothetical protein
MVIPVIPVMTIISKNDRHLGAGSVTTIIAITVKGEFRAAYAWQPASCLAETGKRSLCLLTARWGGELTKDSRDRSDDLTLASRADAPPRAVVDLIPAVVP